MAEPAQRPVTGLAILLWAADPEQPARLATPFFHAAAAGALELEVEIYFSARSVLLLQPGVAEGLRASEHNAMTIAQHMQQALAHSARLLACTDALHANGMTREGLIPAVAGHGGAVQFMSRLADPAWRTLVF